MLFDAFSRGRYSTDASIYQIEPVGVVVPRTEEAARIALQIAAEEGVPILPRGAGTSQCGQSVGAALIIDCSKYLNEVIEFDADRREVTVQPGMVLDQLNAILCARTSSGFRWMCPPPRRPPLAAWPATIPAARAPSATATWCTTCSASTPGSPAADEFHFGPSDALADATPAYRALVAKIHAIARREADEIEARWPKVLRRVQGYNLDMVLPGSDANPRRTTLRICWSVRKARSLSPSASGSSSRRFPRTRFWAWCISRPFTRRWI